MLEGLQKKHFLFRYQRTCLCEEMVTSQNLFFIYKDVYHRPVISTVRQKYKQLTEAGSNWENKMYFGIAVFFLSENEREYRNGVKFLLSAGTSSGLALANWTVEQLLLRVAISSSAIR